MRIFLLLGAGFLVLVGMIVGIALYGGESAPGGQPVSRISVPAPEVAPVPPTPAGSPGAQGGSSVPGGSPGAPPAPEPSAGFVPPPPIDDDERDDDDDGADDGGVDD